MRFRLGKLFVAMASVAVLVGAPSASPASVLTFSEGETASLAELVAGAEIEVGDKLFNDFVYNPTGDAPAADEVSVTGFLDDDTGEIGLLFSGPFAAFGSPALGPAAIEVGLQFDVQILDPGFVFDSVTLAGASGIGGDVGFASIEETILANPGNEGFGLSISNIVVDGEQGPEVVADTIEFADDTAFTELQVTKDLFLTTGVDPDPFGSVTLTSFTQTFGQRPVDPGPGGTDIPEPASVALVLLATAGCLGRRRR